MFGSKKREAKEFQRWVTQEVLPSIRRCGAYVSPGSRVAEVSACGADVELDALPKRRKRGSPEAPATEPLCLADAAGGELFTELVKARCPGCKGRALKAQCVKAYAEFVRLAAQDERRTEASVRAELASSLGARAAVPEKWQALARAAVEASLAASGPIAAEGPAAAPAPVPAGRGRRRPAAAPFVAEAEHGAAKDAANALWIQQLRPGAVLFFLDSWAADTGLALRTTRALKLAGFGSQLHSANPDASICAQLRNEGVEAFEGSWE
jgi:hypothetical protein